MTTRTKTIFLRSTPGLRGLAALALCGSILLGGAATAEANQFKRIRDINVACNTRLDCDLYISNPRVTLSAAGIRREAGPDAPVSLVLSTRESFRRGTSISFSIDGKPVLVLPVDELSYRAAISEYSYRGEEEIAAFVAAAKSGNELSITYTTRSGPTISQFSLSGFVAGLIFMDEVQGRIGKNDAISRPQATDSEPQPGAENAVPADYREIETIEDVPPELHGYFAEGGICSDLLDGPTQLYGSFESPMGPNSSLLGLRCGEGGAYNFPYSFFLRVGNDFTPVALPVMTSEGPSTSMKAWNIGWDEEKKELTAFFKGRGIGDCGIYNRWAWTEWADGPVFILKEERNKDTCDGEPYEIEAWPQTWPVQVGAQ